MNFLAVRLIVERCSCKCTGWSTVLQTRAGCATPHVRRRRSGVSALFTLRRPCNVHVFARLERRLACQLPPAYRTCPQQKNVTFCYARQTSSQPGSDSKAMEHYNVNPYGLPVSHRITVRENALRVSSIRILINEVKISHRSSSLLLVRLGVHSLDTDFRRLVH